MNKKLAQLMTDKPIQANVEVKHNNLYLYGTIGDDWEGVTLDSVVKAVSDMEREHINIYVNSYGGDATEGVAIHNFLKREFEAIDVFVDGIAASSASVIALCGRSLSIPENSILMIHNPWTMAIGNKNDLTKEIQALEALETAYLSVYMNKFKGTEEELKQLLDDETWLSGKEAERLGFAEVSAPKVEKETTSLLVATLLNKYVNPKEATVHSTDSKSPHVDNASVERQKALSNLIKLFG